jgi:hypothetical protein
VISGPRLLGTVVFERLCDKTILRHDMRLLVAPALLLLAWTGALHAAPERTMTWGVHVSLAARWLDPGETEGTIIPPHRF